MRPYSSSQSLQRPLIRLPIQILFARTEAERSIHNVSVVAGMSPISGQVTWLKHGSGSDTDRQSTRSLVVAAQSGDTAAFGSLVELHQQRVFRTARSILGNDADAEDAAQDAFLRAFRHIASFDSERNLSAWLYKLTVNACRDVIRRKHRHQPAETDTQDFVSPEPGPFETAVLQEQRELTRRAIARLPYKERAAITLRDLEGLTTAEVAAALGTTEATVRSQVSAGRAKLRQFILGVKRRKP